MFWDICSLNFHSFLKDLKSRRNPRLVPYSLLDERTKKSNRDSLREAIRTLIGYGYHIEPPDQEGKCESQVIIQTTNVKTQLKL